MGKSDSFDKRMIELQNRQNYLFNKKNKPLFSENGIYSRHKNPIITRDHIPLHWRFDLNRERNPYLMERIGFNATFNAGAMKYNNKYILVVRVEGNDRKSFF